MFYQNKINKIEKNTYIFFHSGWPFGVQQGKYWVLQDESWKEHTNPQ